MKEALRPWLWAQFVWLLMAIAYNGIGMWNMAHGERALVGDMPDVALLACTPAALLIFSGFMGWHKVYRWVIPLKILSGSILGVGRHFVNIQTEAGQALYSSDGAWWAAVLINSYGVVVFAGGLIVVWGLFKKNVDNETIAN